LIAATSGLLVVVGVTQRVLKWDADESHWTDLGAALSLQDVV